MLELYDLPLDTNWERCILAALSREQLSWFQENLRGKDYTWEQAKVAFQKKYGAEAQSAALVSKLHKMRMRETHDASDYADKYRSLMREAGESDNVTLGSIFLNSLTPSLAREIRMTHSAHPDSKPKVTVERVCRLISSLDTEQGVYHHITSHSSDGEAGPHSC